MPSQITTFDVQETVASIMKFERRTLEKYINLENGKDVQLSIYGTLKNSISNLQTYINKIKDAFDTVAYKASVSDSTKLSVNVTSSNNVIPGTHTIVVSAMAKPETVGSVIKFNSRDQALSLTGNLTFTIGANANTVTLTTSDTLESIRDKINNDANNVGVTAAIIASTKVDGTDEYALVVTSNNTGLDNKVVISGTAEASFNFSNTISAAQDASFTFDGSNVVRDTNTISDVMDGITLTLSDTGTSTFTISSSTEDRNAKITQSVKDFVTAYNQLIELIDKNVANRSVKDSIFNMIKDQFGNLVNTDLTNVGEFNNVRDIGIKLAKFTEIPTDSGKTFYSTGRLEIDTTKLADVITNKFASLKLFFLDETNGFNKTFNDKIDSLLATDSIITNHERYLNDDKRAIDGQISKEESRLELIEKQLIAKYTSLQTILDRFSHLQAFVENQLAGMTSINKK